MFTVELYETELAVRLGNLPEHVKTALLKESAVLAIEVQAHIVNQKLHGQVLNQRSGALARSIQEQSGETETGVYGRVFSAGDVKYAAFWEYGFHGDETVKAHMRTVVFGRTVDPFNVGPYTRHVDQAARPFMRPSLAEMKGAITEGYRAAIRRGLGKP